VPKQRPVFVFGYVRENGIELAQGCVQYSTVTRAIWNPQVMWSFRVWRRVVW